MEDCELPQLIRSPCSGKYPVLGTSRRPRACSHSSWTLSPAPLELLPCLEKLVCLQNHTSSRKSTWIYPPASNCDIRHALESFSRPPAIITAMCHQQLSVACKNTCLLPVCSHRMPGLKESSRVETFFRIQQNREAVAAWTIYSEKYRHLCAFIPGMCVVLSTRVCCVRRKESIPQALSTSIIIETVLLTGWSPSNRASKSGDPCALPAELQERALHLGSRG